MGLFDSVGSVLGISGGKAAGRGAQQDLKGIANRLRGFKPIRVRSIMGDSEFSQDGISFTPTGEFAGNQKNIADFFGRTTRDLASFNESDSAADVLRILRQQRASQADTNLSRLESRLSQQGRLGLATGSATANPELQGFFSAEADADLNAQLVSREEARRTGSDLMQRATGAFGLFQEASMPGASNLFNMANLFLGRDIAAANIEAGGARAAMDGRLADQENRAALVGGAIQGGIGTLFCYMAAALYGAMSKEHTILAEHINTVETPLTLEARKIYRNMQPLFEALLKEAEEHGNT